MLEVRGVRAGYGAINVLWDVDLRFEANKLTTIIGPNGAGKTTLLRAIMGQIPVTQGQIALDGRRLDGADTWRMPDLGIALIPEGRMIFRDMSVAENLLLGAYPVRAQADVARRIDRAYATFPRLAERRTQLAGSLRRRGADARHGARLMADRAVADRRALAGSCPDRRRRYSRCCPPQAEGRTIVLVEQNTQRAVDRRQVTSCRAAASCSHKPRPTWTSTRSTTSILRASCYRPMNRRWAPGLPFRRRRASHRPVP
jgi:branched-chain amino acid transport system ATP-binding protein